MLQLEMQFIFYAVKTLVDTWRVDRNKQTVYDYFVGNSLLGERCREESRATKWRSYCCIWTLLEYKPRVQLHTTVVAFNERLARWVRVEGKQLYVLVCVVECGTVYTEKSKCTVVTVRKQFESVYIWVNKSSVVGRKYRTYVSVSSCWETSSVTSTKYLYWLCVVNLRQRKYLQLTE